MTSSFLILNERRTHFQMISKQQKKIIKWKESMVHKKWTELDKLEQTSSYEIGLPLAREDLSDSPRSVFSCLLGNENIS